MLGQVTKIDNKDDRKQIAVLLQSLTEKQRLAWLDWSLSLSPANIVNPGSVKATPEGNVGKFKSNQFPWGSIEQVYFDFISAVQGFHVPMDVCLNRLELMASKLGKKLILA